MPLPQQVINQMSRDSEKTPGWSSGVLFFSLGLLALVVAIYFFLLGFYGPYLGGQLSGLESQVATANQSIASGDETQLVSFYSQVSNVQTLLKNHIVFSQFLSWLEQSTVASVYYTQFSFSSGTQVTLTGSALTEGSITQQIAIFESSPAVKKTIVTNISASQQTGIWSFSVSLVMNPSLFIASTPTNTASTTTP
jgi:hypothetical protein